MAFPVPLEVDGVAAALSHMKGESVVMLACMQRPWCVCARLPVPVLLRAIQDTCSSDEGAEGRGCGVCARV
jgi:hypothetical protein